MKVRQNYIALLRPAFALLPSDLFLPTIARVDDIDQSNQSDALIDGTQSRHVDTKAAETADDVEDFEMPSLELVQSIHGEIYVKPSFINKNSYVYIYQMFGLSLDATKSKIMNKRRSYIHIYIKQI